MRFSYMHTFSFYVSRNNSTKLLDAKSHMTTNYRANIRKWPKRCSCV